MGKSIKAAIERIAQLLRNQVRKVTPKKRVVTTLSSSNAIERIAKLLREELHKKKED